MKRLIFVLLLVSLIVPTSAIFAQGGETATITWWATERGRDTASTRELHFQLARAFEEQHPNIKVAVSLFPSRGFATRILTAVAAGEAPDIWYHYFSPDIAAQGFLEDLTPYIEASGADQNWFPSARARGLYEGRYYGVPRDAVSGFIAYNKDMFDAAGLAYPEDGWTMAEYLDLAIKLTNVEADEYGIGAIAGGDGCMLWSPFSFNLGTDIVSPDGRDVVGYMDTPEAVEMAKFCLELVTEHKVAPPVEMMDQFGEITFMSGKVGMQSLSDWEIPALMEQVDFNWGVVAPPRADEDTDVIPWTDSYMYNMWNGADNKEAVWTFLEWLTGPEAQRMAAEANVWMPNGPEAWEELGWDTDPIRGVSFNQLMNSDRVPNYLRSQYFWDCVGGPVSNIRVRWIESGERDLAAIMTEETAAAQVCLDENYASQQ